MKFIFVVALLLVSLVSFGEIGEAMNINEVCGPRRCTRNRFKVLRLCRKNQLVRRSCNIRRCGRRRWICVPSPPSPTLTASPSMIPTSSPTPSPSATSSPTPSTTPSPSPSSSPIPSQASAYTWGDPHVVTYDGARYDCQATGEFILTKATGSSATAACSAFEVHGRFRPFPGRSFTLSSGIAATEKNAPVVQFSINTDRTQQGMLIQGCSVASFVDGVFQNFNQGDTTIGSENNTVVTRDESRLTAHFPTGMRVQITVSRNLGCYFRKMVVTIPGLTIANCQIVGLFGTPNGRTNDEFTGRDGNILRTPRNLRGREATEFCVNNFAIGSGSLSLFDFEAGDNFQPAVEADELTSEGPDIDAAPQNIQDVCEGNEECLIDGILVDEQLARATLEDEREAKALAEMPIFMPMSPTEAPVRFIDTSKIAKKGYNSFYSS